MAADLMESEGIIINDLFSLAHANFDKWQKGDGCHYSRVGSQGLGKQVAESIAKVLGEDK